MTPGFDFPPRKLLTYVDLIIPSSRLRCQFQTRPGHPWDRFDRGFRTASPELTRKTLLTALETLPMISHACTKRGSSDH